MKRRCTAGAILEHTTDVHVGAVPNTSPKRRNSTPTLLHLAETQAPVEGPPNPAAIAKTPKRWSFFGLESPFVHATGATKRRPSSSSSSGSVSRAISGTSSSDHEDSDGTETGRDAAVASKAIKKKSKKKRVKGWAGSILPLKPKVHKKRSKMSDVRPPTPPASIGPFEDEDDEAEGPQLPDPELPAPQVTITESPDITKDASMNQRPLSKDDASHPMIDLDAALGPFNTPLPHNPEWEAAQRAAGNTGKRRLHSAQGMKGFSGPGMHYHRRAESAPDLPPFDPGRAGINRFGSNSTMADVFEEDEEDDEPASAGEQQKGSGIFAAVDSSDSDSDDGEATPPATVPSLPTGSTIRDTPSSCDTVLPARQGRPAVHDFEQAAAHSVRTECSKTSLQDDVIAEEPPSIIYRSLNSMQGGTDSVGSSPRRLSSTKDLTPVDVGALHQGGPGNMPISPYSTSHASSSHPSPRSPMSMDAQRISTAPSSVTDENSFQSLLMGEPGPEVRISMDYDIPSLTSSNSTMTRDSVFSPNPRLSQPSLREQRPVSVSSAAFGRRRSSLVSLSRLISSSHGERSKLSMEVTLDNDSDNKRPRSKGSKTKQRLGRMMQFWKPNKDGAPS
ncbi:cell wall proline rich protein [Purpureocillium lavendulum]|uniref:Cell wall proline rich protein n=1 Tax=Purpureocillium lavendulum TaxID=1247861 RepID=A0AB34G474_9HYPO|nr:cell wall proline rich protein [Purpureocillium lavendulum]